MVGTMIMKRHATVTLSLRYLRRNNSDTEVIWHGAWQWVSSPRYSNKISSGPRRRKNL